MATDQGNGEPFLYQRITTASLPVLNARRGNRVQKSMNTLMVFVDGSAAEQAVPFYQKIQGSQFMPLLRV